MNPSWVKNGRRFGVLSPCVFLDNMEGEEPKIFGSNELSDHSLKFSFLCNLLLQVRVDIDEGSLTMLDFIDQLGSS